MVTLILPDGIVWRLGLKKADNQIWFVDGWQDFVQRYPIEIGYFQVFRYEGNSFFLFYIFNMSFVELNYQLAMRSRAEEPYYKNYILFLTTWNTLTPLNSWIRRLQTLLHVHCNTRY